MFFQYSNAIGNQCFLPSKQILTMLISLETNENSKFVFEFVPNRSSVNVNWIAEHSDYWVVFKFLIHDAIGVHCFANEQHLKSEAKHPRFPPTNTLELTSLKFWKFKADWEREKETCDELAAVIELEGNSIQN